MDRELNEKEMEKASQVMVPLTIFRNRKIGVLEGLVEYLKDNEGMRFSEIARVLGRHYNTVRTSYVKAKQKKGCGNDGD